MLPTQAGPQAGPQDVSSINVDESEHDDDADEAGGAMPLAKAATHFGVDPSQIRHLVLAPSAYVDGNQLILLVVKDKLPKYNQYCRGRLTQAQIPADPAAIIRRYTSEKGGYCYKVNLALCSDHEPILEAEKMFIRHLKYCIGTLGFRPTKTLYRGVDMQPEEIQRMEELGKFYIPGFTSTSDGGGQFGSKDTLLEIDGRDASWALKIKPEWTDYVTEYEVLLTCYTLFQFMGKDLNSTPRRVFLKVLPQKM